MMEAFPVAEWTEAEMRHAYYIPVQIELRL